MVAVLADPVLYEFTGGEPPAVDVLVARYRAQVAGAGRDGEQWLDWDARRRDTAAERWALFRQTFAMMHRILRG